MACISRVVRKLKDSGELRELVKYGIISTTSTIAGLALRYVLLYFFGGRHIVTLSKMNFTVNVDDNFAYSAYYIFSTILMYLLKWFTARGLKANSFLPRMIAFVALCLVSMVIGNALLAALIYLGMNRELAFWVTVPATFLINYLGTRLLVFRDEQLQGGSAEQ